MKEITMKDGRKPELLAPSGDMEAVRTAVRFGADAVYLGGPFMQLRASSAGFDEAGLKEASELIHSNGRRMYVTVNCFANNDEIPRLGEYARFLKDIGADAVIVSDIGAVAQIKENVPDLEVHVSTQANCMNYRAAKVYYDLGASRIVLARELSLEQIAEIRANTPADLQLEGLIHGAMCMSYSGRCMLSAFLRAAAATAVSAPRPAAGTTTSWKRSAPASSLRWKRANRAWRYCRPRRCAARTYWIRWPLRASAALR